jgi:hypothetical protein
VSVSTAIRSKNYTKVKENTDYIMNLANGYRMAIACYNKNKQYMSILGTYESSVVFHIPEGVEYIKLRTPDKNGMDDVNVKVSLYEYEERGVSADSLYIQPYILIPNSIVSLKVKTLEQGKNHFYLLHKDEDVFKIIDSVSVI